MGEQHMDVVGGRDSMQKRQECGKGLELDGVRKGRSFSTARREESMVKGINGKCNREGVLEHFHEGH